MKILYFSFIICFLLSCSSDEEQNRGSENNDPILGSWTFGKVEYHYNDGTVNTLEPNECDLKSYFDFDISGAFELISYIESGSECLLEESNFEYLRWTNDGSGKYTLQIKPDGQSVEIDEYNVQFKGNQMILIDQEGGYDGSSTYPIYSYFSRIK